MAKAKFAGEVFKAAKNAAGATGKFLGLDEMDAATKFFRFAPDAGFAVLGAAQTPGDLGDKIIAGTTDFVGSAGLGLATAAPFKKHQNVAGIMDLTGSTVGMFGGMAAGEAIQRSKDKMMGGQGLSAYERANVEYEEALRAEILQEMADKGMLNPNIRGLIPNEVGTVM